MGLIEKTSLFAGRNFLRLPVQTLLVISCFGTSLPLTLSVFPQKSSIKVSELEPGLHNLVGQDGARLERVFFNKGL